MVNNDQRNPSLVRGAGETIGSYLERLHEYIAKLEWQSDGHIRWYTHKNPYGCWICETLQVCRLLENELVDLERILDRSEVNPKDQPDPEPEHEPRDLDDK
jgi:hypothetical protein